MIAACLARTKQPIANIPAAAIKDITRAVHEYFALHPEIGTFPIVTQDATTDWRARLNSAEVNAALSPSTTYGRIGMEAELHLPFLFRDPTAT